ncbi:MAG: FAD-dependent oxidoreductase [Myxococcota bacterium]
MVKYDGWSGRVQRRGMLKALAALGLGPFAGCGNGRGTLPTGAKVAVLGAGAGGLSAGYMLAQRGVDFEIFEASSTYGGRMKRTTEFVDFPIPLGAEWLHEAPNELARIVNDDAIDVTTALQAYASSDLAGFYNGQLLVGAAGGVPDLKFVGATWFDFFDTYIVPSVLPRIRFDTPIVEVDYTGEPIVLSDASGGTYEADAVIVSVPLQVLRRRDLRFSPELPADKVDAIQNARLWGGLKVFTEFREAFYPTFLSFAGRDSPDGQHLYYDAAYGQATDAHVIGLFTVGDQSERYRGTADQTRAVVLAELDEVFDGAATPNYVQHIVQDWNAEPFIGQAYLADSASSSTPNRLFAPVEERVFFAGDAYTQHGDWSAVDDAARAARDVVDRLTGSTTG